MFTEAIRTYLVSLGVMEAADWTHQQVMEHVDEVFRVVLERDADIFLSTADEFMAQIMSNLIVVRDALKQDPA